MSDDVGGVRVSDLAAGVARPLRHDVVDRPGSPSRLLVLLHGYGETPAALVDRLGLIDPAGEYLVVTPHAPFDKGGHPVWHRALYDGSPEPRQQWADSVASLDAFLDDIAAETDLSRDEAVVGGFSQGGSLGLGLLVAPHITSPAAVFGICTFVPWRAGAPAPPAAQERRPVLLTGATDDRFGSVELARDGALGLEDLGFDTTFAELPGEHTVTDEAAAVVGRWLARHIGRRPVAVGAS